MLDNMRRNLEAGLARARQAPKRRPAREMVENCRDLIEALRQEEVSWKQIAEMINKGLPEDTHVKASTLKTYYFQGRANSPSEGPRVENDTGSATKIESSRTDAPVRKAGRRIGFEALAS